MPEEGQLGTNSKKRRQKAAQESKTLEDAEFLYRGGAICPVSGKITIRPVKEIVLDASDPVDKGALQFYETKAKESKIKSEIILKDYDNAKLKKYVTLSLLPEYQLDMLMNMEKDSKFLEESGFKKYFMQDGGWLEFGRNVMSLPSINDFKGGNFEYAFDGNDNDESLTKLLKKDKKLYDAWINAMANNDNSLGIDDLTNKEAVIKTIKTLSTKPDGISTIINIYTNALYDIMKSHTLDEHGKTLEERHLMIKSTDFFNEDLFGDYAITRHRKDGNQHKNSGVIYNMPVKINDKYIDKLYCADPFSTSGSTITLSKIGIDDAIDLIKEELKKDENDKYLVREKGTKPLEDCIKLYNPKESKGGVVISMMRDDNSRNSSPISHVPLFPRGPIAIISKGEVDTITNKQSDSYILKQVAK